MNTMKVLNKIELVKVFQKITDSKYISIPEKIEKIVVGLYNSDLKHSLLEILEIDTELFIEGMKFLREASDASEMQIYIPEGNNSLSNNVINEIEENGIVIKTGLINRRENRNNLLCHFEHVVKVAVLLKGGDIDFSYVSVNEESLRKIPYGTKIAELFKNNINNVKFFKVGNRYYDQAIIEKNIEDMAITNGAINAFNDNNCIIHEANEEILEYRKKSCGKCLFCREGLIQLNTMMNEISIGKGKLSYIPFMQEIGEAMNISGNCSLGNESSEALLSSLQIREADYLEHIKKKKCSSGVCISNENIYIDPKLCIGCEECVSSCSLGCIDGRKGYIHMLYDLDCTKCGKCIETCKVGAIKKIIGKVPRLPDRLIKCRMFK
ncbi:NADH-ubiquinone oxidoreductase-F iron-sulfur binding region domain-containing protein [Clostridioides difficile]